jgi:imidazole glycerol-phosphate synthase subunit HisH
VIALIDYGAGNLTSVKKALGAAGTELVVPATPADLDRASGVIVPGVGHFGRTAALDGPWRDAILARVGEGRPLLGICLGMQWLFEGSDEAPGVPGVGLFSGRCTLMRRAPGLKIPHVGWNALDTRRSVPLLDGIDSGSQVYFTHSYAAPVSSDVAATTTHTETFASVVQRGYVAGAQFHPEKSGEAGLRLLRNWLAMVD